MKKNLLLASVMGICSVTGVFAATVYTDGIIIFNQGQYGVAPASANFLGNDGSLSYRIFQTQNPDKKLGITGVAAACWGNNVLLVNKDTDENAGYVTSVNAYTFIYNSSLTADLAGQAYYATPLTATTGYLSTSKGLFFYDLEANTVSEITKEGLTQGAYGDGILLPGRLFVVSQRNGVIVVNTKTNEIEEVLAIDQARALTLTAAGEIIVGTGSKTAELVKIDPETLSTENIDINASNANVPNVWGSWNPLPFVADKTENVIYFANDPWSAKQVGKYDLATGKYTPDFITVPGKATGLENNQILYGQGIAVDPKSGDILMMTVEEGYGMHYQENWVYFVNPSTGAINEEKTRKLEAEYWFPAMFAFPDFEAPEIATPETIELTLDGENTKEINLADLTSLTAGNKHLIQYGWSTDTEDFVTVTENNAKSFTIEAKAIGETKLTVTASFQGKETSKNIAVNVTESSSITGIDADKAKTADVYSPSGVLILRNATSDQLRSLPAGLYIHGNRKVVVK